MTAVSWVSHDCARMRRILLVLLLFISQLCTTSNLHLDPAIHISPSRWWDVFLFFFILANVFFFYVERMKQPLHLSFCTNTKVILFRLLTLFSTETFSSRIPKPSKLSQCLTHNFEEQLFRLWAISVEGVIVVVDQHCFSVCSHTHWFKSLGQQLAAIYSEWKAAFEG